MLRVFLVALALQQPATPPTPAKPTLASPIAKAVITPGEAALVVGDTLRLSVAASDSAGRPYTDVSTSWFTSGGFFEGHVDSTGLVSGGATGTVNVTALVRPKAGGRGVTAFSRITILPQPAAKLSLDPAPTRLYAGQSLVVAATPYAANDDRRYTRCGLRLRGKARGGERNCGRPGDRQGRRERNDYRDRGPCQPLAQHHRASQPRHQRRAAAGVAQRAHR